MDDPRAADTPGAGGEIAAPIRAGFVREGQPLFWLALRQACLTILTLGLWRFWMTTRLRRHYWASVRLMGDPFEYTGTGLEKMVGFLLAVIILAVYLTVVNFAFVFGGLYSTDDVIGLQVAINLSIVASLPLIHFATYRARRYVMARTRWRGIRFGMEPAAWSYALRGVGLTLLTIATLGLLYPLQHFGLMRFSVDRTWYGDRRFRQGGRWTGLMGYWAWVWLGALVAGAAMVAIALFPDNAQVGAVAGLGMLIGYFAFYLLFLRYRVAAFRYMWNHRTLGEARFHNDVDTGEVIGITLAGSAGVLLLAAVTGLIAIAIAALAGVVVIGPDRLEEILTALQARKAGGTESWWLLGLVATGYLTAVPVGMALNHVFMVRPILARQVQGLRIADGHTLGTVRQRGHDHATEAGGFADALGVDIGSGF